ncbi:uncharacterized protein MELLADRAFT_124114 [Melampsora larici-populina 98AG31]|uniref:Secreted protein n=1 Tax=Melampsora larici-populina (strain 98AG31 / pathotype 3-4-7) TaxID=747676 RepID=F4R8T2_MELLP|nr:uncharacterized protein MELLADRAFT_124114 [Melampsora larici-populina 98AG31]EGG10862.1 secreted protein [Melampsora larici-populina 98AG31]
MNRFWLSVFCVATFVSSAMTRVHEIICNSPPGLNNPVGGSVTCYTTDGEVENTYNCDWKFCTQAKANGCEVNGYSWPAAETFTCDKTYDLLNGNDYKIACDVTADYNKKCQGQHTAKCSPGNQKRVAKCKTIAVHSHCTGCHFK